MAHESTLLIQLQESEGDWVDVGHIDSRDERNSFEFLDSYWRLPRRPILGQRFEERGPTWRPSSHTALPTWFSHLLPEGRLRDAVASASGTNKKREFELLQRLGRDDLPGALRAIPADPKDPVHPLSFDEDDGSDPTVSDPILKFSLAGAQLKYSLIGNRKGLTVPASGEAGNVILKLPDERRGYDGVPESEHGSLQLARASGVSVPDNWLINTAAVTGLERWAGSAGGSSLAIDRFDRSRKGRIHMEELAQILLVPTGVELAKYKRANFESVARIIGALCGTDSVGEVIDRIVLNVLIGNGDAHLKNWAVLYPDGRTAQLSPLYDVLPTVLYLPGDNLGMKINEARAFEVVSAASFRRLGERSEFGASLAQARAESAANRILDNWGLLRDYLSASNYERLTGRLLRLRLRNEMKLA